MKRHNPSLAIILACLSTASALNGCQWDSSEYDLYYNATANNTYLCSTLCDTTGVENLREKCESKEIGGTFWNNQCIGLDEKQCLTLTNTKISDTQTLASSCSELDNKDQCPYKERVGIMLNKSIYMYMTTKDLGFQNIYCGTYDEITKGTFDKNTKKNKLTLCSDYFADNEKQGLLNGLKYEDSLELFKQSMISGICPKNTFSCTRLTVINIPENSDAKGTLAFCSACSKAEEISCYDDTKKAYDCFNSKTDPNHCGSCDNDCTKTNQTCKDGICVSPDCPLGQHYGEAGCVADTEKACGSKDIDCLSEQNKQQGWKAAFCGYDGKNADGDYVKTDSSIDDAIEAFRGSCSKGDFTDCKPQCFAQACDSSLGYHLHKGNCISDTHDCCGDQCTTCSAAEMCSQGSCTDSCKEPLTQCGNDDNAYCANLASDINNCGTCQSKCTSESVLGSTKVTCNASKCEATSCDTNDNYHLYNAQCEKDSVSDCGDHGRVCQSIMTGWSDGTCEKGECIASACVAGYDLKAGKCEAKTSCDDPNTHYYNGECIPNDLDNCGKHNNKCSDITGWSNGDCTQGICVPSGCIVGYHLNTEHTACVADDADNCGSVGNKCGVGKVCTAGECKDNCGSGEVRCETSGVVSCADPKTSINYCGADSSCKNYKSCETRQACVGGECVQISCSGKSTLCVVDGKNECIELEKENANHCGACNLKCSDLAASHASSNICNSGICRYSCENGYENCGSAIVPNCIKQENFDTDPNNCGECAHKCNDDEYCSGGKCKKSTCTNNSCLLDSACVNTPTNCGKQCINCNTANNASAGSCSSGTCVITSCAPGYHLSSSGNCVLNTPNACASVDSSSTIDCKNSNDAKDGYCNSEGQCVYTACKDGYHLESDGKCKSDSNSKCGISQTNCTALPGWNGGVCDNGVCKANSCQTNYCLSSNTCVDGQYNAHACGITGNACTSCSATEFCSHGTCTQLSCPTNQHLNASGECVDDTVIACGPSAIKCDTLTNWNGGDCINGKCVGSDLNACGESLTNCTGLPGWAVGECVNGECVSDECTSDYHVYRSTCEQNTVDHCGRHTVVCSSTNLPNSETLACTNAECIITECSENHHLSTDSKSCIANTLELCGTTTSSSTSNCNDLNTSFVDSVECNLGTCKVEACIAGYHITDSTFQTCTENSNSACGSPNSYTIKNCSTQNVNKTCSTAGTCCQDAEGQYNRKPTCCSGLSCWKDGGQYKCAETKPNGWSAC